MKALSVLQPWAHAILRLGKSVENRTWPTRYRGPLLIHAGKSDRCYAAETPADWRVLYGVELPAPGVVTFGALLGVVDLVDCVEVGRLPPSLPGRRWAEGPWCWVLANPRAFPGPVPYRGAQMLFDVPAEVIPAGFPK